MCNEYEGCFRFGRYTVVWDNVPMKWALYDATDTFIGNYDTLADAKTFALGRN